MADAVKKRSFFQRISRFFKDIVGEMKKVVWPSKSQVRNNTLVVLTFMILMGIVLGLFDTGVSTLVNFLLSFFGGMV